MERENTYLGVDAANGSPTSSYPPSYHSAWETESKFAGKEPTVDVKFVLPPEVAVWVQFC